MSSLPIRVEHHDPLFVAPEGADNRPLSHALSGFDGTRASAVQPDGAAAESSSASQSPGGGSSSV